ncbi:hypothetical protein KY284_035485 [Solanum tuberosum]|nr:hypothetical protein KY284_035485 [Solanum tuberosum]
MKDIVMNHNIEAKWIIEGYYLLKFLKLIWLKDVNEEILRPTPVSTGVLTRTRIINVTNKYNQDGYWHPRKS